MNRPSNIRDIEIYVASTKLQFPGKEQSQAYPVVVVRILTDSGMEGVGEAPIHTASLGDTLENAIAQLRSFEPALKGLSPHQIALAHSRMKAISGGMGGRVPEGPRGAIDMAMYDLMGKSVGLPVHEVLGGGLRKDFEVLGTEFGLTMVEKSKYIVRYLAQGYKGLECKVRIDGELTLNSVREQAEMLREVLDLVPVDVEVIADMNQRWGNPKHATLMASEVLGSHPNLYFEQPTHYADIRGMAEIRKSIPYLVIADESATGPETLQNVIRQDAADMVSIKLPRVGGFYPALTMLKIAESAGLDIRTDTSPNTLIGDTATIHLAACVRTPHPVSDGWTWLDADFVSGGAQLDDRGTIHLPDAPGLGLEVDFAQLDRAE